MRWLIGFILHEMAFGLLSVFLPLYITVVLGGSLTDVGMIVASASLVAVPFSFFWGYLSDKTRRYRFYILLSFAGMATLLYLFSLTNAVPLLIGLYIAIAVFHVAHEAPKNVLISEYYSRPEWERSFASFEAWTSLGWLSGLLLGLLLSVYGSGSLFLIFFCSFLNLIAFVVSFFSVKDPVLVFERRLVAIERALDFAHRGFSLASKALDGMRIEENLRGENVSIFCGGLLLFSLATSMLFTPLPVFFYRSLGVPQSLVFGIFAFNAFGGLLGCVLAGRWAQRLNGRAVVKKTSLVRGLLSLALVSAVFLPSVFASSLSLIVLTVMEVASGFFLISTLSISMELVPEGKAGAFNALIGLGVGLGSFLGTFTAENYGFSTLFIVACATSLLSYMAFKTYAK
jgi:MFS family permease